MTDLELSTIVKIFGNEENFKFHRYGKGLINDTFIFIDRQDQQYILQKINKNVFKNPLDIDYNTRVIRTHLRNYHPRYFISLPVESKESKSMIEYEGEFFRIFSFIKNSHTLETVENSGQAYQAALQFGKFTSTLSKIDTNRLKITLPDFHNLNLRFKQYLKAIKTGNPERVRQSNYLIKCLSQHLKIVEDFNSLINSSKFNIRITHHDTKISNVLFDREDKGICVIDLDTVMPGYFISDLGDMFRTYLSPVSEEEKDFSKIGIRSEMVRAIIDGYMEHMSDQLTEEERHHLIYAGKFMIYMQAIRFLTDYLNNDIYYGAAYEEQNFIRAGNQINLLEKLSEFERSVN